MKWRGAFVAAVVFALLSTMSASAASVVLNGGFETATDWTFTGNAGRNGIPQSGSYGAKITGQDNSSRMTQTINWGGGAAVLYVAHYRGPACGVTNPGYRVSFAGVVRSFAGNVWAGWQTVGVDFGTVAAGTYELTFYNQDSFVIDMCIDNVSMEGPATPTPAPTNTPTLTPTLTPTIAPSPTPTNTSTPFPTFTLTPVPTALPTFTATSTNTPIPSLTPLPTPTNTPALTRTPTPTRTPGVATGIIDDRQLPNITASTIDKQVARWIGQNWLMLLGIVMIGFDILDQFLAASQKTLDSTVVRYTKQMAAKDGGVLFVTKQLKGADAERMIKDQGVVDDDDDDGEEEADPGYQPPPWLRTTNSPNAREARGQSNLRSRKSDMEDSPSVGRPSWSD